MMTIVFSRKIASEIIVLIHKETGVHLSPNEVLKLIEDNPFLLELSIAQFYKLDTDEWREALVGMLQMDLIHDDSSPEWDETSIWPLTEKGKEILQKLAIEKGYQVCCC